MTYPLLPYSKLVFDLMKEIPGIYDIPILLRAPEESVDVARLERSVRAAILNHPVLSMRLDDDGHHPSELADEFVGQFHRVRIYREDGYVYVSAVFNRILGDTMSFHILLRDISRSYRGLPLELDRYWEYLAGMDRYRRESPLYTRHRRELEAEFSDPECPLRPHTDSPLETAPVSGSLTDIYPGCRYRDALRELTRREHISLNGFFSLCAALAIMDYEGADEAALTWAYMGRDDLSEADIFGSLHRDIPFKLAASDDRSELFAQVRDGMRRGIACSDYPFTLTPPNTDIWNFAVNVIVQPDLSSLLEEFPFQMEVVDKEEDGGGVAYSLLDIEIYDEADLKVVFRYSASHYEKKSIERFSRLLKINAEWLLQPFLSRNVHARHKSTAALQEMILRDRRLFRLLSLSIDEAAAKCPDHRMNPVRTLEDLHPFLDSFLEGMPWEGLTLGEGMSLFRRMDQCTGYFLFLTDQRLEELESEGLLYPSVQYMDVFADWIRDFNDEWRTFLDSPDSWNEEICRKLSSDPSFALSNGWYEDPARWHSWNDFFSRRLSSPDVRPIGKAPVVAPCDGILQPLVGIGPDGLLLLPDPVILKTAIARNAVLLFGDSPFRHAFNGGRMVHQLLDFYDYHRVHSPVDGTIVDMRLIDGISGSGGVVIWDPSLSRYRYESPDEIGFQMIETRGLVVLDSPSLGLVALLMVGMAQVCSVNWSEGMVMGASVRRGDEIGYFLCGGSDVMVVLQKDAAARPVAEEGTHALMGADMFEMTDNDE